MKSVHVVAVGAFGEAVANHLAGFVDSKITKHTDEERVPPCQWPPARIHVLAAWRPVPKIATGLDTAAFESQVPWLPVICEHPFIYLGPVVVPGVGPCYSCFYKRHLQHSNTADLTEILHSYYTSYPSVGPRGYLHTTASFSASIAWEIIQRVDSEPESEAGQIRCLDVVTLETIKGTAVGLHGCKRCGIGRDERMRSVADLATDLKLFLQQARSRENGSE